MIGPALRQAYMLYILGLLFVIYMSSASFAWGADGLTIEPPVIELKGPGEQVQIRVLNIKGEDVTAACVFKSHDGNTVRVSNKGQVISNKAGQTKIEVVNQSLVQLVAVKIAEADAGSKVTFEKDLQPILTRYGCNAGSCHGKQRGQNGFQLSLLGFDNDFDFYAITSESRGRRIFPASPKDSLLLKKASGQVPHGGGKKIPEDGNAYAQVLEWIKNGQPRSTHDELKVVNIEIIPSEVKMLPRTKVQTRVLARYSDGTSKDVTHLAAFQSSESVLASIDAEGMIQSGPLPGEAAIMARFMEKFSVCLVTLPLPETLNVNLPTRIDSQHYIDRLLSDKFVKLGLSPSDLAADHTYLRRVYLDLIGRLPTPEESRSWLAETAPDKKEKLALRLLSRPEYADFWANKWADLLRPNPFHVGMKAVFVLHTWLRDCFRKNLPYDQFAKQIITADGSTFRDGASVVIRDKRQPDELTTVISRLFLGIRLECAKCHHHPFEVYGQDDFYHFAAFFGRIGKKGTGISAPISGSEEMFFLAKKGDVKHLRTGEIMKPAPLKGKVMEFTEDEDPRQALAAWITSDENPLFAKAAVNRIWADLMGRGLVDAVDDLRATNPPSNPALLDALADDFRKHHYDVKHLLYTIVTSKAYALSSKPNERNQGDTRNHSRHYRMRPRAEVLLDMVSDVTGVAENFPAMPEGSRAMEMWTFRSASEFLDSFGRPDPNQDPPCERSSDSTVVQALHLMNAKNIQAKIVADNGIASKLASGSGSIELAIEDLYLRCYCRFPTNAERDGVIALAKSKNQARKQTLEDLLWALINSPEFVLVD